MNRVSRLLFFRPHAFQASAGFPILNFHDFRLTFILFWYEKLRKKKKPLKSTNYAPNFEKVEGAYCFGLVRPSVTSLR